MSGTDDLRTPLSFVSPEGSTSTRVDPRASLRIALTTYLVFLLAMLLPYFLANPVRLSDLSLGSVLAWSVTAYAGTRLAILAIYGAARLMTLTFWLFTYVWMGLAPLIQFVTDDFPLHGFYSNATAIRAFFITALGIAAFEIGTLVASRTTVGDRLPLARLLFARFVSPRRVVITAIAAVAMAAALLARLGGWEAVFLPRVVLGDRTLEIVGAQGQSRFLLFSTLLRVPICVVFFLALHLWYRRKSLLSPQSRIWALLFLFVAGVLNLVINNPVNSPRYWFGTIALGSLFLLLPTRSGLVMTAATLLLIVLLLFLFPHADIFRRQSDPESLREVEFQLQLQTLDYDAYQQLMNATLYVADNGFGFGKQILGTLLFWAPRSIWPGKPQQSGPMVAENAGYIFTNLSMPLWGEMYLDGGILAVILGFLLYGFTLARIERVFLSHLYVAGTAGAVAIPIFAAYQIYFLRGALMSAFAYLVPIVAVLALCTTPRDSRNSQIAKAGS